jgi:hypothetical protein
VTDAANRTAYKSLFIDVGYTGQSVCASGACSANLLVGQPHLERFPFLARGVPPYQIFVWGQLPPGFVVNDSDATIGGVPSAAGIYDFSVELLDSLGKRDTVSWSVTVTDPEAPSTPPSPSPVPPSTRPPTNNGGGGGGGTVEIAMLVMLMLLTTLRALAIAPTR